MSKARELANLGNAYSDGALSNRNLIINGDFQVSQRGNYTSATTLTNNTYYLDRFVGRNGVAGTIQQTSNMPTGETGNSVKMVATASGTGQLILEQFIEPQTWMQSKTYTASCWIRSNSSECSITLIENGNFADRVSHTGGGNWEKITLTFDTGGTLTDFRIRVGLSNSGNVSISSGDYFEFTQLQVEVGDTATPFEHRSYGDELARCQRYYYQEDTVAHFLRSFYAPATGDWYEDYPLPVVMRTTPTWTSQLGGDVSRVSAVSISGRTAKSGYVRFTVSSTGQGYCSLNTVTADAEL